MNESAPSGGRTHTGRILSPLPLPLGYRGHDAKAESTGLLQRVPHIKLINNLALGATAQVKFTDMADNTSVNGMAGLVKNNIGVVGRDLLSELCTQKWLIFFRKYQILRKALREYLLIHNDGLLQCLMII